MFRIYAGAALFIVSALSLALNLAVFIYHFYRIFKFKRNLLKEEIYVELEAYKEIKNEK